MSSGNRPKTPGIRRRQRRAVSVFTMLALPVLGLSQIGCADTGGATNIQGSGPSTGSPQGAPAGSNVSFGGSQDVGFMRGQLEAGQVPSRDSLDAAGFFAEHHTELPPPTCGERVCLQPMTAVMGNLMNGNNCTMLQLG